MVGKTEVNIYIGTTSIYTCLGNKFETLAAMNRGRGGLSFNKQFSMFTGSLEVEMMETYTRFESLMIDQLIEVLSRTNIKLSDPSVQLIISTTKGNVELLEEDVDHPSERTFLYTSAELVAARFLPRTLNSNLKCLYFRRIFVCCSPRAFAFGEV